jgi:hypothetical protein
MKGISLTWVKNLPEDKAKDFEIVLRNSTMILGRLKAILQEELQNTYNDETMKDFEDPNWSHKQAFRNGDRSRIRKTLNLLEFIPT